MDWIFENGNRLNGTGVATVRVRPLRLTRIIRDDDPQVALRVIELCYEPGAE